MNINLFKNISWLALVLALAGCGGGGGGGSDDSSSGAGGDGGDGGEQNNGEPNSDSDSDGLTLAQEEAGWQIIVDRDGYGLAAGQDLLTRTDVTSDPSKSDTDEDGLSDNEEFIDRTNPNVKDTDGDGLSDYDEKYIWKTNPLSVDSDGDARLDNDSLPRNALFDGAEALAGTSPSLADTDGDGKTDFEEFDDSQRTPLIAEIPQADISITGNLTIQMNVEYEDSVITEKTYGNEYSTTNSSSTSRTDSESTAVTIAASSGGEGFFDDLEFSKAGAIKFFGGKALEMGRSAACDLIEQNEDDIYGPINFNSTDPKEITKNILKTAPVTGGVFGAAVLLDQSGACDPATPETTNTTSTSLTRESSQSATESYSEYQTDSQGRVEKAANGTISVGLKIKNVGISTFELANPSITVMQWQPSPETTANLGAGGFKTFATLEVKEGIQVDGDGNRIAVLAPNQEVVVQVEDNNVNPEFIKALLARPQAIFFSPANFAISDQEGANFQFLTENTYARTAVLVIDDGVSPVARYQVATNVDRNDEGELIGVSMDSVLSNIVDLDYDTVTEEVVDPDTNETVEVEELFSLAGLANQRSNFRGNPEEGVPGDPQGLWVVYTKREEQASKTLDFADIRFKHGDEVRLIYIRDEDGDGIYLREENTYGSSDQDNDSDDDNVSDFEELKVGWQVTVKYDDEGEEGTVSYRVLSDPTRSDADGDNMLDNLERQLGTDPNNRDTDDDGISDSCDADPLDNRNSERNANEGCLFVPRFVYTTGFGIRTYAVNAATGALTEIESSPAQGFGDPQKIVLTSDAKHAYTVNGGNGSQQITAYDVDFDSGALEVNPFEQLEKGSSGLDDWRAIAIHPSEKFLAATDYGPDRDRVYTYTINGEDSNRPGQLTLADSDNSVSSPTEIVFDPLGQFMYVLYQNQKEVYVYEFAQDGNGEYTSELNRVEHASFELSHNANNMAMSNDGSTLYLTYTNEKEIYVYNIDRDNATLTLVPGSPFDHEGYLNTIEPHPSGDFVYTGHEQNATYASELRVFQVNKETNTLTEIDVDGDAANDLYGKTGYNFDREVETITIDESGNYLYAGTYDGIFVYAIDKETGLLTLVEGSPFGERVESITVFSDIR